MRALFLSLTVLFASVILGQEHIKLERNIGDDSNSVKSLEVLDFRKDKDLGEINVKGKKYTFSLPEDLSQHFQEKFNKDVKNKGENNILILIEEIKMTDMPMEKGVLGISKLKITSFLKKQDGYYIINRLNTNTRLSSREYPGGTLAKMLSRFISIDVANFIKKSYNSEIIIQKSIKKEDITNYETILTEYVPAFFEVKEGVYSNVMSFLMQKPEEGFELVKNDEGKVQRAVKGEERIGRSKIAVYVDEGKTFINTNSGFMELQKDEKGFYVYSNKGYLYPVQMNSTYGMFGLIGGIAGAIEANAKNKKAQAEDKYNIYIDPFSGEFEIK